VDTTPARFRERLVVLALTLALGAASNRAAAQGPVLCSGTSPEGVTVSVRIDAPLPGDVVAGGPPCDGRATVAGAATATTVFPPFDLYLIVDCSGSTGAASGVDVDEDGVLGAGSPSTDPGDAVLAAEVRALSRFADRLLGLDVRASVVEFSAVIPNPGPGEQGRIRVVTPLTSDLSAVSAGLADVQAGGSRGATDYAGAIDAALGELARNGAPGREAIALFLTDGKPTFPRYPYDSTEAPDYAAALEAADRAALAGLAIDTHEIGAFDDRGILAEIASRTGGLALPSLDAEELLDALPDTRLTGVEGVELTNVTTGETVAATLAPDGTWSGSVGLAIDLNVLRARVTARNAPDFEVACETVLTYDCRLDESLCFRATTDAVIEQLLLDAASELGELGALSTCAALDLPEGGSPCGDALREHAAMLVNRLDGRLTRQCGLDLSALGPGLPTSADEAIALTRLLILSGTAEDCDLAARIGLAVNSGAAIVEVAPPPPEPTTCVVVDPDTGLEVTVTVASPVMGGERPLEEPCDDVIVVEGATEVSGATNLFDLFFVIDSSGSTGAASGRDIDGDGIVGVGNQFGNTDPGDSVLRAELEAVRRFVADLDPAWARVSIIQFSNPDGFFGLGELQRVVQSLTADFAAVNAALDAIAAGGSAGATDYGGALALLQQEYLATADPANRIPICFFLSDGIPTWPTPPYDSTEAPDRQAAIDGATWAAANGIEINTYEVGLAGASAILQEMADITGGQFYRSVVAGDIVQVLNEFNLVPIASVVIENLTSGETSDATVSDDGSFTGGVGLLVGENTLRITVTTGGRTVVTGECTTDVELLYANLICRPLNAATWAAACTRAVRPEARLRRVGADPARDAVVLGFDAAALADGHRVYRGDLDLLWQGAYGHVSPFTGLPGDPECLLPAGVTTFADAGALRDGRDWYYLVVAIADGVEGSFGWADRDGDSLADIERPAPADDPGDLVVGWCP
jgi:hypothetical protein